MKNLVFIVCFSLSIVFGINITFQVNMQYTDSNDGVYIRGGNIGSELPDSPSMGFQMTDENNDDIYVVTLELETNTHYTYCTLESPREISPHKAPIPDS